jgi:hypothetical protein
MRGFLGRSSCSLLRPLPQVPFIMLMIAVGFSGCGPSLKQTTLSSQQVYEETERQRKIAFETAVKREIRLQEVSARVLAAATKMGCSETVPSGGFGLFRRESVKREYQDAGTHFFGGENVVKYLVPGMPAAQAGLLRGDMIKAVNGIPAGALDADRFGEEMKKATIVLAVERDGTTRDITVPTVPVCRYATVMVDDGSLNAYADGSRVVVTSGMIRSTERDDELAMMVAHEVGHNVLGHMGKKRVGAAVGTFFDLLIAGTLGVGTGGVFGQAGAAAYSKTYEAEADYAAVYLVASSGYDITNAAHIWRKLAAESPSQIEKRYLASHPSSPERFVAIDNIVKEVQEKERLGQPLLPDKKQ